MAASFKTESWLWYGIVMTVVALRFVARMLHFKSFYRFQIEDYLMLYVTFAYTSLIVLINISAHTNTNLIDPHDIPALTPEDIAQRTYGSKINIGVEQSICNVQWGTKACLLFLYYRLTENLVQNYLVKCVGVFVAATFVVMEVLYMGYWCRPFPELWKTPTMNVQCATMLHHLVVNLSFNLTSDIMIMSIPLPLLLRTRLEIKRKIIICFPFTLGFFSIICAILSKHVSFTHPYSGVWVFWYTREASCVMIVANMPYTWSLARRVFKLSSFWGRASNTSRVNSIGVHEDLDRGTVTFSGQMQEIRGVEPGVHETMSVAEKPRAGSIWRRVSLALGSNKQHHKSPPIFTVSSVNPSEKSPSTTGRQSDDSNTDEQWQSVDWSKGIASAHVTHIPTNQNSVSPDSLAPPPASFGSNVQRTTTNGSWRVSTREFRRMSTHSSRRSRQTGSQSSRRGTGNSVNVDAIDRLYRLDDEDLVADLEAARPRSQRDGYD